MTASLAGRPNPFRSNLLRSRKPSARTPPSTFLFLPIHFSNSPKPCSSVPRLTPEKPKTRTSDAATRTWPRLNGRMLGHRVNSEGLRRRVTALSGSAPKRRYIVFGLRFCQPSETRRIIEKAAIFAGFAQRRRSTVRGAAAAPRGLICHPNSGLEHAAPHCGHIPPPFFALSCRGRRHTGQATASLEISDLDACLDSFPRPPGRVDGREPSGHRARGYSAYETVA